MSIDNHNLKSLAQACLAVEDEIEWYAPDGGYGLDPVDLKFIAACKPATILALLAENERLRKLPTCWTEVVSQSEENDELLDQVLLLSADADRYRYLCRNAQMLGMIEEGESIEELSGLIDQGLAKERGQ